MKVTVYRINLAPDAPKVLLPESEPYTKGLQELRGQNIVPLLPSGGKEWFKGKLSSYGGWNQIYAIAPGGFAVSEESWDHSMSMYYLLEYGDTEIPPIVAEECSLRIVNPLQILPPARHDGEFCDLTHSTRLFRIAGQPPTDLFCLEGTEVPGDEFKYIYDEAGFKGLEFEAVWQGDAELSQPIL